MKKILFVICLIFVFSVVSNAHDLFLKLDDYFLVEKSKALVKVLNGTFQNSDGAVKLEGLRDISLVTPDNKLVHPELPSWRRENTTSLFDLEVIQAGNYVIGVSTKFRDIELKAKDFNGYLEHDGIPDILAQRKASGEINKDVKEKYSKHVKAIFQSGSLHTDSFKTPLNYPVEIIPQQNPYLLKTGENIEVQCLLDGKPINNQLVVAGCDSLSKPLESRTNSSGIASFPLKVSGKWYIKFIYMEPSKEPGFNYESKWASLTFAIK
jgi:uncharacterized GH25 family protein